MFSSSLGEASLERAASGAPPGPGSPPPPLQDHTAEIDALRETGALFYARGWSVGTSSNYSIVLRRDPLELLVTASGKDKGRLTRADFVCVGPDGQPTQSGQAKSSAETLLHVAAAEDENVGAVLHTHSVWATLLSEHYGGQGGWSLAGYEMLKGLAGISTHETSEHVEIFANTQNIPTLAEQFRQLRTDAPERLRHGYLIHKHGLYTWGRDLAEARRHIEIYEFLFECEARKLNYTSRG